MTVLAADKPPYVVPSMAEVAAARGTNGHRVVSSFSGGGGSCLGLELAGFEIIWASEFIPEARRTYEANHPGVPVDGRDIREVTATEILAATGLDAGELDLFEGSPPCASFSTAGQRHRGWGIVKDYSDTTQRSDDLFWEYARLLGGLRPKVFVAENVSGLVKGVAKGYFKRILRELARQGYRVEARMLDAQWLGVPQARKRMIFLGVREDLSVEHRWPAPLPYAYAVNEVLPWIARQGENREFGRASMRPANRPSPTFGADPSSGNGLSPPSHVEVIERAVHDTSGQFDRTDFTRRPAPAVTVSGGAASVHFQLHGRHLQQTDPETGAKLLIGGRPALGGRQRRRLTLAELRVLCSFPADFELTGTYAQRWERLGRSVPPLMMAAVGRGIAAMLDEVAS